MSPNSLSTLDQMLDRCAVVRLGLVDLSKSAEVIRHEDGAAVTYVNFTRLLALFEDARKELCRLHSEQRRAATATK